MRKALTLGVLALLLVGALPVYAAPAPDEGAFRRLWERTDAPVASGQVKRTWYWGDKPLRTLDEEYVEGVAGKRRVQYWDKGRMEISNPSDNPSDPWYVTSGLLSIEMIGGRAQVGDRTTERLPRGREARRPGTTAVEDLVLERGVDIANRAVLVTALVAQRDGLPLELGGQPQRLRLGRGPGERLTEKFVGVEVDPARHAGQRPPRAQGREQDRPRPQRFRCR